MDSRLVEKITRMIISELEGRSVSVPRAGDEANGTRNGASQALTDEELERWKVISDKLAGKEKIENLSSNQDIPLTDDEIKKWKELHIPASFVGGGESNNLGHQEERVKFSPF